MSKESVQVFIMKDGDETSKEQCTDEADAIIRGAVKNKTPWRVTTTVDEHGQFCNKHERYSFFRKRWEAR